MQASLSSATCMPRCRLGTAAYERMYCNTTRTEFVVLAVRTHVDEVSTIAALIAPRGLVGSHVKLFFPRDRSRAAVM